MKRFLAPAYQPYLQQNRLDTFDALWSLSLTPVDAPNLERGGHSEVCRLTLEANGLPPRTFFIKRQINHLGRSLQRPLGEPTFAREARNINAFHRAGIPALDMAYYEEQKQPKQWRSILITPELDGYTDMIALNARWQTTPSEEREAQIETCGKLLSTLHRRRWRHGSLYAKHVFLRRTSEKPLTFEARFIDLEKSRPLINAGRERRRDLEVFARRLDQWQLGEWQRFLGHYLSQSSDSKEVTRWIERLTLPNV